MQENHSPAPSDSTPVPIKVSVLILCYNDAAGLRRCLTSLESQTNRAEMEILVMDNGSTDGSGAQGDDFPNVTILRLPRNFGAAKALNIGMRSATGDYVFFLAPEMELAPDAAATLAAVMDADGDAAATCPLVVDAAGQPVGDWWKIPDPPIVGKLWKDPNALARLMLDLNAPSAPVEYAPLGALMVRRFFVKGLNYFDERYGHFGPDLELAFQIRRGRRKTLLIPAAKVTRHPAPPLPSGARSIVLADRLNGAAAFLGKHHGFLAGFGLRLTAGLGALFGFQPGLALDILSGSKIDGSQSQL